jgi:zinc protease
MTRNALFPRFGALLVFVTMIATPVRAAIDIQEITTPAGFDLWLVQETSIPFVAIEIAIEGGASLDLPGKRGAANLMTGLLEEGAGELSAQEFQAKREALAASFRFNVYDDSISISARMLSENRTEAAELLHLALTEPRFDEDAIERVRAQILSGLASDAKNPNRIAGNAFYSAAFENHPYGSSLRGTKESVSTLNRDDILAIHKRLLTRDRVFVSAVGDISAAEVSALVDNLLDGLPADGPDRPQQIEFGLEGGTTVIDFPTPQAVALFGHSGIKRDDDDFFVAYVLNTMLGGSGRESILMHELREKRGLTYGVSTYLVSKDFTDLLLGSVASSNETIAEAMELIRIQWQEISQNGVDAIRLEETKTYLTGAYPLRFDGNAQIAEIMLGMQMQGLSPDYVVNRNEYIEAVTLEDISRVAAELLKPDALHFVVVGQPVGLE